MDEISLGAGVFCRSKPAVFMLKHDSYDWMNTLIVHKVPKHVIPSIMNYGSEYSLPKEGHSFRGRNEEERILFIRGAVPSGEEGRGSRPNSIRTWRMASSISALKAEGSLARKDWVLMMRVMVPEARQMAL
jgi:hypothetical protein